MGFKNFLTTPSGRTCYLNEVSNREYLDIIKFTNASDYGGFYSYIDELIKATVPEFDEFDILDKAYVYLGFCFYSVKTAIPIKEKAIGGMTIDGEVGLPIVLENIESKYVPRNKVVELSPSVKVTVGYPRTLVCDSDNIAIDYSTSVKNVNGKEFSYAEIQRLMEGINPNLVMKIWQETELDSPMVCNLVEGDNRVKIMANLCSPEIFYIIFMIFHYPLDVFYNELYIAVQYMRLTMTDFYKMSRLEFTIFIKNFNKDKEEQKKENKTLVNPEMEDAFLGR